MPSLRQASRIVSFGKLAARPSIIRSDLLFRSLRHTRHLFASITTCLAFIPRETSPRFVFWSLPAEALNAGFLHWTVPAEPLSHIDIIEKSGWPVLFIRALSIVQCGSLPCPMASTALSGPLPHPLRINLGCWSKAWILPRQYFHPTDSQPAS